MNYVDTTMSDEEVFPPFEVYTDENINKLMFRGGLYSISVYWGEEDYIKVTMNDIGMIASDLAKIIGIDHRNESLTKIVSHIVSVVTNIMNGRSIIGHTDFGTVTIGGYTNDLRIVWSSIDVLPIVRFFAAAGCTSVGFHGTKKIHIIPIKDNVSPKVFASSSDFSKAAKKMIDNELKGQKICSTLSTSFLSVYGYGHNFKDVRANSPISGSAQI